MKLSCSSSIFTILQILSYVGFFGGASMMYCLCTRTLRENYEARSILSALYFSEDLMRAAVHYLDKEKDVETIRMIVKQHAEVREKVVEIRTKRYSYFSGIGYKCKPVYDLKFPKAKEEPDKI